MVRRVSPLQCCQPSGITQTSLSVKTGGPLGCLCPCCPFLPTRPRGWCCSPPPTDEKTVSAGLASLAPPVVFTRHAPHQCPACSLQRLALPQSLWAPSIGLRWEKGSWFLGSHARGDRRQSQCISRVPCLPRQPIVCSRSSDLQAASPWLKWKSAPLLCPLHPAPPPRAVLSSELVNRTE